MKLKNWKSDFQNYGKLESCLPKTGIFEKLEADKMNRAYVALTIKPIGQANIFEEISANSTEMIWSKLSCAHQYCVQFLFCLASKGQSLCKGKMVLLCS